MPTANAKPTTTEGWIALLREKRLEIAARCQDAQANDWRKLAISTRCVLLMMAGVDAAEGQELSNLAAQDWREFTWHERFGIAEALMTLRDELMGVRWLTLMRP